MLSRYQDSLNSMVLSEENIKKVVKYRVSAMAIHPSDSIVLVAAGDKSGQIGLWNVVSRRCALRLAELRVQGGRSLEHRLSGSARGVWGCARACRGLRAVCSAEAHPSCLVLGKPRFNARGGCAGKF